MTSPLELPLLGSVDPGTLSLPVLTVALASLDAFNPCAFFVLLFLLSLLVHARYRWRMLLIGGVFVFFSGLIYFVFMAAWLNVFLLVGELRIITLLAGLRSVPDEPKEAALVDGASKWQTFFHVIVPHMRGQILIVLLIRSMDVFKTFDIVYALTFGGPGQSTTVATFYLYRQAFTQFKLGYGAALSWIIFIIIYLITFLMLKVFRAQESAV
jgi:ABC-type sugar transport system permease subunit